jgi:holo-[acyl-carrier protein] synthase
MRRGDVRNVWSVLMAIVGEGVDMVDVSRMKHALGSGRVGERLKRRVFTADERAYCEGRGQRAVYSYAARFAAKEAVKKALGGRTRFGFAWPDIEVVRTATGAPRIILHGRTKAKAERFGARRIQLSITHIDQLAIAHAVLETR